MLVGALGSLVPGAAGEGARGTSAWLSKACTEPWKWMCLLLGVLTGSESWLFGPRPPFHLALLLSPFQGMGRAVGDT